MQAKYIYIKTKELTIYKEKSLCKYQEYIAIYNIYFIIIGEDKFDRIELAAIYLRGNTFNIWVLKEVKLKI